MECQQNVDIVLTAAGEGPCEGRNGSADNGEQISDSTEDTLDEKQTRPLRISIVFAPSPLTPRRRYQQQILELDPRVHSGTAGKSSAKSAFVKLSARTFRLAMMFLILLPLQNRTSDRASSRQACSHPLSLFERSQNNARFRLSQSTTLTRIVHSDAVFTVSLASVRPPSLHRSASIIIFPPIADELYRSHPRWPEHEIISGGTVECRKSSAVHVPLNRIFLAEFFKFAATLGVGSPG